MKVCSRSPVARSQCSVPSSQLTVLSCSSHFRTRHSNGGLSFIILRKKTFNERSVHLSATEIWVCQNLSVQGNICVYPLHDKHLQGSRHAGNGFFAILSPHD